MRIGVVLSFLLVYNLTLFGQAVPQIKWGKDVKTPSNTSIKNVCFYEDDAVLIRKKAKRLFTKEKWLIDLINTSSLEIQKSVELSSLFNDPKIKVDKITSLKNDLFVTGLRTQNKSREIVIKKLNSQLLPDSKTTAIDTINEELYISHSIMEVRNIPYLLSTFVLEKNNNLTLKIKQIDSLTEIKKTCSFTFNLPIKTSEVVKLEMVSNNLVYALIKHSPKSGGIFEYDLYSYSLMACDLTSGQFKEFEIELPEKNITDIGIKFTSNNSLMVSGFYSNKKNTQDDFTGVFYLNISNTNLNIIGKGIKELPVEFLKHFLSERKLKKKKELSGFTINFIIPNTDGGTIILAEQSYNSQICNTDFRTGISYCNDYYYYNDIIAIRINVNGEIEWTSRLAKNQVSINDNGFFSSYFPFVVKNGIYFIYNENPRNIGVVPENPNSVGNFKKAIPARVFMDNAGKVYPTEIISGQKQTVILRPKIYFQRNILEGVVLGKRNGNDVLGKIFIESN
jgi:hypothetical protein